MLGQKVREGQQDALDPPGSVVCEGVQAEQREWSRLRRKQYGRGDEASD